MYVCPRCNKGETESNMDICNTCKKEIKAKKQNVIVINEYAKLEPTKVTKNIKMGKFLIKNVPHRLKFWGKNEQGEYITKDVTSITTDMVLHEIVEYMEKAELTTYDYSEWVQVW